MSYAAIIAKEFNVREDYVQNIIALLDEGNTIPFIARYRKEQHGAMDDQLIRQIADKLEYLRNLDKRRAENRRYVTLMEKKKTERRQAKVRFQNRKKYKYFKCPGCKAWLRLPRGAGVVTVTCSRCHTSFTQKA